jgi:hypothetical protein
MDDINETIEKSIETRKKINQCLKNYDTDLKTEDIVREFRIWQIKQFLYWIVCLMGILGMLILITHI